MKRFLIVLLCILSAGLAPAAQAQAQQPLLRLVVRDKKGSAALTKTCKLLGCSVVRGLGDPTGELFLVSVPNVLGLNRVLALLSIDPGITTIELDQLLKIVDQPTLAGIPQKLTDKLPQSYYGSVVTRGFLTQPASSVVGLASTQSQLRVTGAGTVALIDTGVDVNHPALSKSLLPGYDFTRNSNGADETGDIDHSTAAVLDGGKPHSTGAVLDGGPTMVNPGLAANISARDAALLGVPNYSAFGHGTMTAGLVHLVAPTAKILPLKAFSANGSAYSSDVVRALYYAAGKNAKVVSMSFDFKSSSKELASAIAYVQSKGIICVAAAGNDGGKIKVYPASIPGVMGVASSTNYDTLSTFSNYGSQVVWVAAPGEEIVSTYPFGTYATSSGTSFSTPMVAGTAALFVSVSPKITQTTANQAVAHAKWLSPDMNNGRLDIYQAVKAWMAMKH